MQRSENKRLARITTVIALVAAFVIGAGLPATYYGFTVNHERGQLAAETDQRAAEITQIISRSPDFWQFDGHAIEAILAASNARNHNEFRQISSTDGFATYVYRAPDAVPSPHISTISLLYESGAEVGTLEVRRTIRPLVFETLAVAAIALALGIGTFAFVRLVPMREMEEAWAQASHDTLTGLPNRVLLNDRIERALARMRQGGSQIAIFCLDLDHFKRVNDTFGHHAGDKLLKMVAERLVGCVRPTDTVARLSGDEFAILMSDVSDTAAAAELARRIIDTISQPFIIDGNRALIGTSIGIAVPENGTTAPNDLLRNGDTALYRAKATGRQDFRFFSDTMNEELKRRQASEQELLTALEEEQLTVHYQPQISLESGRIVGVEALLRWNHPSGRSLEMIEVIALAEETGLIVPIGEFVLRRACTDGAAWGDLRVAVNVSPVQFVKTDLAGMVQRVLTETGFEPARLELEITESVLIERTETVLKVLSQLRDLGIRIAMDDFGTGYSSLSYLRKFPFDKIKIDRSFLKEGLNAPESRALIRSIIDLSHSLDIAANAEGVETLEQAEWLAGQHREEAQGFHFAPALPAKEIRDMIAMFRPQRLLAPADPQPSKVA